jgi:hypothetical protein
LAWKMQWQWNPIATVTINRPQIARCAMKISVRPVILILGGLLACVVATDLRAAVIDDFSAPASIVGTDSAGSGTVTIDGARTGPSILGSRQVLKHGVSAMGGFLSGDAITVGGPTGTLRSFSGPTAFATGVTYDFTGLSGGSTSFAGDLSLDFDFDLIDGGVPGAIGVDIVLTTTSGNLTYITTFSDGANVIHSVLLSNFVGPGSLANVTGLNVIFNNSGSNVAVDFILTSIGTTPMPEPGTMLAWGTVIGLGWVVSRRHRIKSIGGTKPDVA